MLKFTEEMSKEYARIQLLQPGQEARLSDSQLEMIADIQVGLGLAQDAAADNKIERVRDRMVALPFFVNLVVESQNFPLDKLPILDRIIAESRPIHDFAIKGPHPAYTRKIILDSIKFLESAPERLAQQRHAVLEPVGMH